MSGGPFHVLRHRDFRLLWLGLVGSAIGTWMQIVAQALLVLDLTHGSAFALGEVSLAQAAAFFVFSLFGGAVADHVDKRKLLLFTQTICMSLAILLGVLDLLHVVRVWMIVVLAFTNGVALSFDQPTRAALIPELVPKDEILSAFSLQAIVFTGASTVGPALAGLLLPKIHYAGVFFANGASYLLILGALFAIRFEHVAAPTRTPSPQAIKDGLAAVKADVALPSLLLVYGAM
ncbi:MAG TPA: MFS transporter, partial [Polyangiaceae bacterium]